MKKYKTKTEKNYNFFALEFKIPKLSLNTKPTKFATCEYFCEFSMNSKRFLKYLERGNLGPQCKKFHRLLLWSDFVFKDSFGILNKYQGKKFIIVIRLY